MFIYTLVPWRGFINIFSKRATTCSSHRQQNILSWTSKKILLYMYNVDGQTRQAKSSSQPVSLSSAGPLMIPLHMNISKGETAVLISQSSIKKYTSDTMMSICLLSFLSVLISWSGSRWIPTQQPFTNILVALQVKWFECHVHVHIQEQQQSNELN